MREGLQGIILATMTLIFYWITIKQFIRVYDDPSGALQVFMIYIILWTITALFLYILNRIQLIDFKTTFAKIGTFLLTPIPTIIMHIIARLFDWN